MDREYNAQDFFFVDPQFQALICRKCGCAVRPQQAKAHLTSTVHCIPITWAKHIQGIVQGGWDHIEEPPNVEEWPRQINEPIAGVPVYEDGILCLQCQVYTCRELRTMKAHWVDQHGYRVHPGGGRPTPGQAEAIRTSIERHTRPVSCQRLFTQGPGSHYIRVAAASTDADTPVAQVDAVDQIMQQIREFQRQDREAHQTIIQAGDLDEATPWLNRTGWPRYLQGTPARRCLRAPYDQRVTPRAPSGPHP